MNPQKAAADKAREIVGSVLDAERRHVELDLLLCAELKRLGYDDLVRVFEKTTRFYA